MKGVLEETAGRSLEKQYLLEGHDAKSTKQDGCNSTARPFIRHMVLIFTLEARDITGRHPVSRLTPLAEG